MSKTSSGSFNHLKDEKSPYLQQHARNPVDWRPWSDEAFNEARKADKPVIISIGYSSCHWCHVMEAESFEDAQTAQLMNDNFICIKIDREERPDLDSLYMKAVQAMTGTGGWPLTVFATPQGEPFYGGSYFPPVEAHGLPSFRQLLTGVARLYRDKKDKIVIAAADIISMLAAQGQAGETVTIDGELAAGAFEASTSFYDPVSGGFGRGTKFPHAMFLKFLLKHYERTGSQEALEMLDKTLVAMAEGGIYDHIGGGFHRYSVDETWAVPHFEKMLYDNALLIDLYSCAHVVTGRQLFKEISIETIGWLLREMQSPQAGFYSAMDADSDGREGAYYLWEYEDFKRVLEGVDALRYASCYSVSPEGNLDGQNTLRIDRGIGSQSLPVDMSARIKAALFNARSIRTRPDTDRKIITAWNGLAITALARAGRAFDRPEFVAQAERCADFIISSTVDPSGRLMRYYLDGRAGIKAGLEDYAIFASSLLALHEAGGAKRKWLDEASRLAEAMIDIFYSFADGRFYDIGVDQEALFLRERDLFDNDVPSGNSAAAGLLLQLSKAKAVGKMDYARLGREILQSAQGARDVPLGYGNLLCVVEDVLAQGVEP